MVTRQRGSLLRRLGLLISTVLLTVNFSYGQVDSTADYSVQIKKIFILGNDKTKTEIITRELRFKEGDIIMRSKLDELLDFSRNNIYNTNLFQSVEIQKIQLDSTSLDILIRLEERWYVWPSFMVKPVDRNLRDWWVNRDHDIRRVTLGPKLDIYNVGGRKESLRFIGLFGFEKRFIAQYKIPYIEKTQRHGLTLSGTWLVNNDMPVNNIGHITTYLKDAFADSLKIAEQQNRTVYRGFIEYRYRPSFNNYHYVVLDGYQMSISDSVASYNPNYFGNGRTSQKTLNLIYAYISDYRNNRNYPLSGHYFLAQVQKFGFTEKSDFKSLSLTGNVQYYRTMKNEWFVSTSLAGQISTQKDIPYFNRLGFGEGTYYVKGFEDYVIQGPMNVLWRSTIKKRIFDTELKIPEGLMPLKKFRKLPFEIYPKAYFDYGYIKGYPEIDLSSYLNDKSIYSIGLGLDIVMLYDVTFRLETSYTSEGKIKFAPNFMAELQL